VRSLAPHNGHSIVAKTFHLLMKFAHDSWLLCARWLTACIRILYSKSAAGVRPVWLTNHCRNALTRWRELFGPALSPFVFPSPRNPDVHFVDYKTAWRTAAKKAGLADRRIYDLRSTFASRANVCHATGLTVAHLRGHASTQILPTYVRPVDENTRALIEAMDAARKNQRVGSGSVN